MEITVSRYTSDDQKTRSMIHLDGKFECYGLEDAFHEEKIYGDTRISNGTYMIGLRDEGGMTKRYKQRYPDDHRGMLHILDVPEFEWIYIHIGNNQSHTQGCLLVGDGVGNTGSVTNSAFAYNRLYKKIVGAAANGSLTITFIDLDR